MRPTGTLAWMLRIFGPPIMVALAFLVLVFGYAALPDDQAPPPPSYGQGATTVPTLLQIIDKPIPAYTPGATAPGVGLAQLCPHLSTEWAAARRTLGTADRRLSLARYGIADPERVSEWDHLVPRELGGADTIGNLWPMTDRTQDQRKDRLENALHRQVCAGQLNLSVAQQRARTYWMWW